MTTVGDLSLPGRRELHRRLVAGADTDIGFPNAVDLDSSGLSMFTDLLINNVGYPFAATHGFSSHTLDVEAVAIAEIASLFRAPSDDFGGYVTSGSTEAIRGALLQMRKRFNRHVVLYASSAAHTCVRKLAFELCIRLELVPATAHGEMDYEQLAHVVAARQPRRVAVAVVATIGTTMYEAIDDVRQIHAALDMAGVPDDLRYVHADAALAGLALAGLDPDARPAFDVADGADSLNISGHKYLGVPVPCGVLILRPSRCPGMDLTPTYTGAPDLTPAGSRSGHSPLMILWALRMFGRDGLRERAETCRRKAAELSAFLNAADIPTWRHPLALTVVVPRPSDELLRRWPLPTQDASAHVIWMPGKPDHVYHRFADEYIADQRRAVKPTEQPLPDLRNTTERPAVAC